MELLITLGLPAAGFREDVRVELDPVAPVDELRDALAEWATRRGADVPSDPLLVVVKSSGECRGLDPFGSVFDSGLVSGSTVQLMETTTFDRLDGTDGSMAPERPTVALDITSGPEAGRTVLLPIGRQLVGRARDAAVQVHDPAISRHHFTVDVSSDLTVTIEPDPEASNPTLVAAEELIGPRVLEPEEAVFAGTTQFVLRGAIVERTGHRDRLGQVAFNPLPYRRPVVRPRKLDELERPPDRPGGRRFSPIMVLVPLAASALIVVVTGQIVFLIMAGLSPLMMVSNHFSEGRLSQANYRREGSEFRKRVSNRSAEVTVALEAERRERLTAAPDVPFLSRQAAGRLGRLWERPRGSPDFLQLRLGLGTVPSHIETPIAPGGDPHLRQDAAMELEHHAQQELVPVTLPLDDVRVAGVYGPPDKVNALARSLVLQAALLHSPEQLVVAAAVPSAHLVEWSWLKWLPHCRSATSPLEGPHLVDEREVAGLIDRLAQVVVARSGLDHFVSAPWPRLLVVIHELAEPNRAALASLLDSSEQAGIVGLWVGEAESQLPRQCRVMVRCSPAIDPMSNLRFTDPKLDDQDFLPEGVEVDMAERIARSLSPVRDVSSPSATTGIPRMVPLFDLPDIPGPDHPVRLAASWVRDRGYALSAPLGTSVDGTFALDLVSEGPHALIAGTSGAGKSELLQTLVCSLASRYSPERLNFLFIDYKGGASSAPLAALPHTVGSVTNLDERLARRALVSLRAELRRRMAVLEGRAKDLAEMLDVAPAEAPPSLVIVVDEFATLVQEIPDFVAGMVDVAQRGRSLGIHLVLATQRPTGAVNDNILANTNLRIALRVLDSADSTAVIGAKDAAAIPVPLRGRAYARTGPGALMPFQCAWSGAPYSPAKSKEIEQSRVLVQPFPFRAADGDQVRAGPPGRPAGGRLPTQLDALVEVCATTARSLGLASARPPWVQPLSEQVSLASLLRSAPEREKAHQRDPGRWVTIGLADLPDQQRQALVDVDLEADGGLLVFGSGGSGKTTLLRTVASDLAGQGGPDEVRIWVLDFSGRSLTHLEELPHVAAVATGDDLERVTRMLTVLDLELERRRHVLAEARIESISALRAQGGGESMPRMVLLLDGYAGFHATFEAGPLYSWVLQLVHLVTEGRQVGIHTVITNNRLLGVPTALTSAVSARVVMRMATTDELVSLGVPRPAALGAELGPGRAFIGAGTEMQVATVSEVGSGASQVSEVTLLAEKLAAAGVPPAPTLRSLPDVARLPVRDIGFLRFPLGIADLTLEVVEVDVAHQNLVVVGPTLSGRSTALAASAAGIRAGGQGLQLVGIGAATSPLAHGFGWDVSGFGRSQHRAALEKAAAIVEGYEGDQVRLVLVIDTIEDFEAMEYNLVLEPLVRSDAVRVVAACDHTTLERAYSGWMTGLKRNRAVLVLQPASSSEVEDQARVRPALRPGQDFPPGRGVLVDRGRARLLQVGIVDERT